MQIRSSGQGGGVARSNAGFCSRPAVRSTEPSREILTQCSRAGLQSEICWGVRLQGRVSGAPGPGVFV